MDDLSTLFSLGGQTAVVTGAAGGIGRATAELLARAGARVALLDLEAARLAPVAQSIDAAGGAAVVEACDITDADALRAVFQRLGTVDILVNNAAVVRRAPALDITAADWRTVMSVNLDAAFACACEAARAMPRGGAIVNMASIMGLSGGLYPNASYQASKGALVNLTRALAVEWAPRDIRVNAVAPAWVRTEFTAKMLDDPATSEKLLDSMPLRRFPEPSDVAAAVLYLASPASRVITGHILAVDSGFLSK